MAAGCMPYCAGNPESTLYNSSSILPSSSLLATYVGMITFNNI